MGIGFNVEGSDVPWSKCPHWSYSGFHSFRKLLAKSIGVDLEQMEGFSEWNREDLTVKSKGTIPWSTVNDPLVPLLHHSDCDGELSPSECAKIAPRLREVCSAWVVNRVTENNKWIDSYDQENGLLLADAMDLAAKTNKPLVFC